MIVFIIGWLLFLSAAWYSLAIRPLLISNWLDFAWVESGLLGITIGAFWMLYTW